MAKKEGKNLREPDEKGFVEEPEFDPTLENEEAAPGEEPHESEQNGREPNYARVHEFLEEYPEFALKAQKLAEKPEEMKREIIRQDIIRERQFESRYNGVWAKLSSNPKLFQYYNHKMRDIPDGPERRKAICKEYYESLKIEGNYINPRFYDRNVTDEQVDAHIAKDPEQMKRLDKIQAEGNLMMVYARNEYYLTAGERRAQRKVEQFLQTHEPDRKQIDESNDEELRASVIRDTFFKASRRDAIDEIISDWLDKTPGFKDKLEKEHAGKAPEHMHNSILKDASEAYRKATGKSPKGDRIEFSDANIKKHMAAHPEIYDPIKEMSREELIAKDVQRRINGAARAWQASKSTAKFNDLLKHYKPELHKQIITNARYQQEPFRTQKIAKSLETKGLEFLATNPQLTQRSRSAGR